MTWGTGLRATLHVRLGFHDAHYAGELVDGAKILSLFGDVATELLIRLDGDEGLFRAYESVEFLAPVHSGDFVEVSGVVTRMGTTSRQMAFEARVLMRNPRTPPLAPSAADVLPTPVVVCRAIGTCVVPVALQRNHHLRPTAAALPGASLLHPLPPLPAGAVWITPAPTTLVTPPPALVPCEVILTAAIVGAEITKKQTPYLPITPEEIGQEAALCVEAGAAVIHLHVRNLDGSPSQAAEHFREAIAAIRQRTDAIIQVSTGGAVGMPVEERCGPLECRPEMATLNCGSINFGNDIFINTRPQIREIARRIHAAGSQPELECYDSGHLEEVRALVREGALAEPLHIQFVLGLAGGAAATEAVLRFLVGQLPSGSLWGCAAVGKHQQPMTELAIKLGGHARVGLEDNIYLTKGVLSQGSAPLVERAATYARSVGRSVASTARAREILTRVRA